VQTDQLKITEEDEDAVSVSEKSVIAGGKQGQVKKASFHNLPNVTIPAIKQEFRE